MSNHKKIITNKKEWNYMLNREGNCLNQSYSSLGRMMYLAGVKEEL